MSWCSLPTWELTTSFADSDITTPSEDSTVIADSENSLVITDNPYFIVTVSESNDLIIAEGVGPKGDPGYSANALKDPVFTYNVGGDLTRVDYQGGSYKAFTYDSNGNLSRLEYLTNGTFGIRTFVYVNDVLQRIED